MLSHSRHTPTSPRILPSRSHRASRGPTPRISWTGRSRRSRKRCASSRSARSLVRSRKRTCTLSTTRSRGRIIGPAIYYWVNKVSHAQVYNYGKHMMFDVIVPEPAAIFKKLYELKLKNDKNAKAPPKPTVTPQAIQRNTPQLRLFLASQRIASESTRKWK